MALYSDNPEKDSGIQEASPATTFGGDPSFIIGWRGAGQAYRTVMHFDISSIPSGSTINSATLTLECIANNGAGGDTDGKIYRLTQTGWVEAEVTWDDYATATPWATAGGDYHGSTPTSMDYTLPNGATGPLAITLTSAFVTYFIDNTAGQMHLMLKAKEEHTLSNYPEFDSLEGTTPPLLEIDYTAPSASTTPSLLLLGIGLA